VLRYDFILNRCSSSNSDDLIRLIKRVILFKCKPFVVYLLSLNFCYSIVANLFYFYIVYYLFQIFFIMASFPCGKYFLECEGEKTIACDNCDKWFHQKCESLSCIQFSFLGKSSFSYFCSDCCLDINANFRFFGWLTKITTQRKRIHNWRIFVIRLQDRRITDNIDGLTPNS
jgi:hypothetical protein